MPNVRVGQYELDLVLRRGNRLLVVEVKEKGGAAFGHPLEMIDEEKVRRVHTAAAGCGLRLAHSSASNWSSRLLECRGGRIERVAWTGAFLVEGASVAPTQAALYDELAGDLHLSWSEAELPERERTARAPPPSVPRQVRPAARRGAARSYVKPGGRVLDPFAGSGTTLVQCLESGYDAVGVDIAAFNCL